MVDWRISTTRAERYANASLRLQAIKYESAELKSDTALRGFERAGYAHISNLLPASKAEDLAAAFTDIFKKQTAVDRSITVGTRRVMMPIPIEGVFNDEVLYANRDLTAFLSATLGASYLLSCYTCIVAEPGAPEQHRHRDYEGLFNDRVDYFSPSFGVNLFVPLVPLNRCNGSIRIWESSHRRPALTQEQESGSFVEPELEIGDALLMDYRILHQGTANLSNTMRAMLCICYSRDWFIDCIHFKHMKPFDIDAQTLSEVQSKHPGLFNRAVLYQNYGG